MVAAQSLGSIGKGNPGTFPVLQNRELVPAQEALWAGIMWRGGCYCLVNLLASAFLGKVWGGLGHLRLNLGDNGGHIAEGLCNLLKALFMVIVP